MTNADHIIEQLQALGAQVAIKSFDTDQEVITVFVNKTKLNDPIMTQSWKHGIFLIPERNNWVIGYSQSAKTRPLSEQTLMDVMKVWVENPADLKTLQYYDQQSI